MADAIENLEKFIKNGLSEAVSDAMLKAVLLVEGDARRNCPVDDGQLRMSIMHDVVNDGKDINGYVGTNLEYAPYIHQGTGIYAVNGDGRKEAWKYQDIKGEWHTTIGMKPNPFVSKAVDDNKTQILKQFENIV